jgi:hypothetical protein
MSGLSQNPEAFESVVAVLSFADGNLSRIRLLPVDLNFDSKDGSRGRPQLASSQVAKRIVERAAARSARFGTKIRYDADENAGDVVLGYAAGRPILARKATIVSGCDRPIGSR